MIGPILSARSILVAIFMFMGGSGFVASLVSLRLESGGSRASTIGLIATAYFAGLTIGSLRALPIIRRVGHIRTFVAAVSLLSASTLSYALYQHTALWAALRFLDGLCVAGVFVCLESWLNTRAESVTRGAILAAYMIALYAGQAAGQFLLNLNAHPSVPFIVSSLLISLSVLPIALTRLESPAIMGHSAMTARELHAASPLGIVGVGVTGLILGAFYALGAVYAQRLGVPLSSTAFFMSVVIAGGVALQWPIGWLSDRIDRRRVIVGTFAGAAAVSGGLAMITTSGPGLMLMGAAFGGLAFALYPLCVAHTNDHLTPDQRVGASGGLVLVYSIGAAAGPIGSAGAMMLLGPGGLFVFVGFCAAAAFAFGIWRQIRRAPIPEDLQQPYQALPRTTAVAAALDPHSAG
ncbi:MFS transporter [Tsuneonella sp. YG55]|uniref:MFS transporter n=1 Tax=Tsuneonella litorea TaxID=2976475 RepID=A0A9X2W2V6_9SPHN|nr:MFS transporter [Tsuneonella litorea]MCT2559588.1 MFS transporter [Tsuneonella litorea]